MDIEPKPVVYNPLGKRMTDAQKNKLEWITSRLENYYGRSGRIATETGMDFKIQFFDFNDDIMISASNNNDLRWFETHYMFFGFVGPRGGLRIMKESTCKP